MSSQEKISSFADALTQSLFLAANHLARSQTVNAASAYRISITHYENGKPAGTHLVPGAWYAFAVRMGYFGEWLDELWHCCQEESLQNDPRCRHML